MKVALITLLGLVAFVFASPYPYQAGKPSNQAVKSPDQAVKPAATNNKPAATNNKPAVTNQPAIAFENPSPNQAVKPATTNKPAHTNKHAPSSPQSLPTGFSWPPPKQIPGHDAHVPTTSDPPPEQTGKPTPTKKPDMVLANIFSDPPNVSATKKAQFAPDTKEQRKQESAAKALQSARASLKAAAETWTPKKACNPLSLEQNESCGDRGTYKGDPKPFYRFGPDDPL